MANKTILVLAVVFGSFWEHFASEQLFPLNPFALPNVPFCIIHADCLSLCYAPKIDIDIDINIDLNRFRILQAFQVFRERQPYR